MPRKHAAVATAASVEEAAQEVKHLAALPPGDTAEQLNSIDFALSVALGALQRTADRHGRSRRLELISRLLERERAAARRAADELSRGTRWNIATEKGSLLKAIRRLEDEDVTGKVSKKRTSRRRSVASPLPTGS